jgi:hypothetical protein
MESRIRLKEEQMNSETKSLQEYVERQLNESVPKTQLDLKVHIFPAVSELPKLIHVFTDQRAGAEDSREK